MGCMKSGGGSSFALTSGQSYQMVLVDVTDVCQVSRLYESCFTRSAVREKVLQARLGHIQQICQY